MVSTRFAGLDGVSLEARKVASALQPRGHAFSWFAGELDPDFAPGVHMPAAYFGTPENVSIETAVFGNDRVGTDVARRIGAVATEVQAALLAFIDQFAVEALMVQNALAIPMQLPLGIAATVVAATTGMPVIGHHHDFAWERERFARCALPGVIDLAFPPALERVHHVVINFAARDALFERKGIEATVLPNVMDFESGPPLPGDGEAFREAAGLGRDAIVLLQPTRVIPRKGIELTIELARRLNDRNVHVVVSHPGDLDAAYWERLRRQAEEAGVDLRLVAAAPGGMGDPRLADAYAAADLVCYPSLYEGFGNALLEAFFYGRPVFVNRYPVFRRDIEPLGVECITIDGAVDDAAVRHVEEWLADPQGAPRAACDHNYELGRKHFSYSVVRERLGPLLET